MDSTNEFSFILKPSEYGIGVFATHEIKKGAYLRLFREETEPPRGIHRKREDVPEPFNNYCLSRGDILRCPRDFGHMEVGWYMNHSDDPTVYQKDLNYYALRNIQSGEEITVDYNSFNEPEEDKADYYKG